jgi:hypothetical protein
MVHSTIVRRLVAALALVGTIGVGTASAQTLTVAPVSPGCRLQISVTGGSGDVNAPLRSLKISVNSETLIVSKTTIESGNATVTLPLVMLADDRVKVRSGSTTVDARVGESADGELVGCDDGQSPRTSANPAAGTAIGGERVGYGGSAYVGAAIDTFAPASVGNYAPGTDTTPAMRTRAIGGVDFSFRLVNKKRAEFWIAGQTLYGARSADFCATPAGDAAPDETCVQDLVNNPNPQNFRKILMAATSLEAYVAPRLEFGSIDPGGGSDLRMKPYATVRYGFIALSGGPKLFYAHHVGGGFLAAGGKFDGSAIEFGWGRTDLFLSEAGKPTWNRLKIDGLLSYQITGMLRGFVQLYVDASPRSRSADAVQTFIGIDFELGDVFRRRDQ